MGNEQNKRLTGRDVWNGTKDLGYGLMGYRDLSLPTPTWWEIAQNLSPLYVPGLPATGAIIDDIPLAYGAYKAARGAGRGGRTMAALRALGAGVHPKNVLPMVSNGGRSVAGAGAMGALGAIGTGVAAGNIIGAPISMAVQKLLAPGQDAWQKDVNSLPSRAVDRARALEMGSTAKLIRNVNASVERARPVIRQQKHARYNKYRMSRDLRSHGEDMESLPRA